MRNEQTIDVKIILQAQLSDAEMWVRYCRATLNGTEFNDRKYKKWIRRLELALDNRQKLKEQIQGL